MTWAMRPDWALQNRQEESRIAEEIDGVPDALVYFIQAVDQPWSPVKIGLSTKRSLKHRVDTLQIGNPFKLRAVVTAVGGWRLEKDLHERFAESRMSGEWFRMTVGLQEFMRLLRRD